MMEIHTLLGEKGQQTQRFLENGQMVPVTIIGMEPNVVVQIKTREKDGYDSLQLGYGSPKTQITKAISGHFKKAGTKKVSRFLQEVRVTEVGNENPSTALGTRLEVGKQIRAEEVFKAGDKVKVTGISKGKGFAGVVKRYHFKGGPKTHGQSDRWRAPGAIGSTTTPGRVLKGKRMAGHLGNRRVTVKGLQVLGLDAQKKLLIVKGLVPGPKGGLLKITKE